MTLKIYICAAAVLLLIIAGLSIGVSSLRHECDLLRSEIERLSSQLALSAQSLMQSNEAISRQNARIKLLETQATSADKIAALEAKYKKLKAESDKRIAADNSCESRLSLILSQQRQFMEATP